MYNYYFKGTCDGTAYEKNPNDVEYDNYLFGGVFYSLNPSRDKTIIYSFDILTNHISFNSSESVIEYKVDSKIKSNYYGSFNENNIIKLFFENVNQSPEDYEEIIFQTIKQYSVISKEVN